jgi:hypothetical protein
MAGEILAWRVVTFLNCTRVVLIVVFLIFLTDWGEGGGSGSIYLLAIGYGCLFSQNCLFL